MDDDDRRVNETIARACGWTKRLHGWGRMSGPYNDTCVVLYLPDYLADPARLPGMWALCREKGQNHGCTYNDAEGAYIAFVYYDGPRDWAMMRPKRTATDDDPQRAFARALAAAIEAEEG